MATRSAIQGRVWKYGDDVNTDVIFPGKYTYTIHEPSEMAQHALEDLDPDFVEAMQPGDVIVGGINWGCGSSREQAVICLKALGIGAIVAKSFARIYYRNCINSALPAIVCPQAVDVIQEGETIEIDLQAGTLSCRAGRYSFPALPEAVERIFEAGGLVPYTRERLEQKDS
jgi:3-isopropylmalate/(R)-2-methylmalate dehydratase small subunit